MNSPIFIFFFQKNNKNNELNKLYVLEPIQLIVGIRQLVVHFIHLTKANILMNKINHKLVHSIIQFLLHHQKKKWVQKNKMSLLWFDIFPSKRNANSQKWLIIIILYTPNTAVIPPKKNSIIAVVIENLDLEVIFCDYTQNLEKTK